MTSLWELLKGEMKEETKWKPEKESGFSEEDNGLEAAFKRIDWDKSLKISLEKSNFEAFPKFCMGGIALLFILLIMFVVVVFAGEYLWILIIVIYVIVFAYSALKKYTEEKK